jgi:hypothetical protein
MLTDTSRKAITIKTRDQYVCFTTETYWPLVRLGLREGSRLRLLVARSRGFNSPQVHSIISSPRVADNYSRGSSSGRSQKDGVAIPAVILAHVPEESKVKNDVPQLPDRNEEVWTLREEAHSALPL